MFEESFEKYRARIHDYMKYSCPTKKDIIIFLLWEILEILWHIGKSSYQ